MNLPDWAIWWAGGVIVAAGLVLLAWGWRGDRARGRRRCPKCWQELGDIPGRRCPECGHEAQDERALGRTRRRRWAVSLGLLLAAGVLGGAAGYRVYNFCGQWLEDLAEDAPTYEYRRVE